MKKHAFRIGLVVTMLLGLMMISANAVDVPECPPHDIGAEHGEDWTEWTPSAAETLTDGKYYLSGNVTVSGKIFIDGDVTICLNGKTFDSANTGSKSEAKYGIELGANSHLILCDCSEAQSGKITSSTASSTAQHYSVMMNESTFDMWGGSISGNKGARYGTLYNNVAGSVINLYGGKITNNVGNSGNGGGVYLGYGTLNMFEGFEISNNKTTAGNGGGLYVGGTFNMHGGKIQKNYITASSKYGAGVYVGGGTFNMYGGTITENGDASAYGGGGVVVAGTNGKFNMYKDAVVSLNKADRYAGIYVNSASAIFNMYGGTVEENILTASNVGGGGISVNGGAIANLYDGAIKDNNAMNTSTTDTSTGRVGGGVNLMKGTVNIGPTEDYPNCDGPEITGNKASRGGGIYVKEGTLNITGATISGNNSKSASYGNEVASLAAGVVTITGDTTKITGTITMPATSIVTGGTFSQNISAYVPAEGYVVNTEDIEGVTYYKVVVVVHPGYSILTADTEFVDGGKYYMADALTVDNMFVVDGQKNITVCLHGNTLTTSGVVPTKYTTVDEETGKSPISETSNYAFYLMNGATLNLCDCSEEQTGTVTPAESKKHLIRAVRIGATEVLNLSGGILSGFGTTGGSSNGGSLYVAKGGAVVNMSGGTIEDSITAKAGGGAIWVGGNSTFNMTGGTITNCVAQEASGGAIQLSNGSIFNMSGGTIEKCNSGTAYGGALYVGGANTVASMTGGTMDNNQAYAYGGGVYVGSGATFTLDGGTISNNSGLTGGGGLGAYGDAAEKNGGTIIIRSGTVSGNKAGSNQGGGVFLRNGGTIKLYGGTISGNTSAGGAGIYCFTGTVEVHGGEITGNNSTGKGGGISALSGSDVKISGGVIKNNKSEAAGAAIYCEASELTMEGGYIYSNDGSQYGEAVYIISSGTFNMTGGSIGLNESGKAAQNGDSIAYGGALTVWTGCNATISGGNLYATTSRLLYKYGSTSTISVTGGSLNKASDTYIAPGYYSCKVTTPKNSVVPYEVVPCFDVAGSSVTLGNDLQMNFFIAKENILGNVADYSVSFADGTSVAGTAWEDRDTHYVASYDGIAAKEMCDAVEATVKYGTVSVINYTDSVRGYLARTLDLAAFDDPSGNSNLVNALMEMLRYGAAAQTYFEYNVENLADAGLAPSTAAVVPEKAFAYEESAEGLAQARYLGSSVSLQNNIVLKMYFTNDVTSVTVDGEEATLVDVTGNSGTAYKAVVIESIKLPEVGKAVTVVATDAEGGTVTITDSIEGYAYTVMNGNDEDLQALCQAMMNFVSSVKAYFDNM